MCSPRHYPQRCPTYMQGNNLQQLDVSPLTLAYLSLYVHSHAGSCLSAKRNEAKDTYVPRFVYQCACMLRYALHCVCAHHITTDALCNFS